MFEIKRYDTCRVPTKKEGLRNRRRTQGIKTVKNENAKKKPTKADSLGGGPSLECAVATVQRFRTCPFWWGSADTSRFEDGSLGFGAGALRDLFPGSEGVTRVLQSLKHGSEKGDFL